MSLVFTFLGFAAAVPGVELFLRALIRWRAAYYVHSPRSTVELELSPEVSSKLKASATNRYNIYGERGDDPKDLGGGTTFRAVLIGGSTAECFFLNQDRTIAACLQARLTRSEVLKELGFERVEVSTVARSSLRSIDAAEVLTRMKRPKRLVDAIILHVGSSDGLQWLIRGAPSAYVPSPRDVDDVFSIHPEHNFGWSPRRTAIAEIVRRLNSQVFSVKRVVGAGRFLSKARALRRNALWLEDFPDSAALMAHVERGIRAALIAAIEITPNVYFVPQRYFYRAQYSPEEDGMLWLGGLGDPSESSSVRQYVKPDGLEAMMTSINGICQHVASELGAQVVDTRESFDMNSDFFYDDFHLTELGADAMAGSIAEGIEESLRR